jgi:hypothetical protein
VKARHGSAGPEGRDNRVPPGYDTMALPIRMFSFIAFSVPKTAGIQLRASYLKDCVCTALGSVRIMTFRCFLLEGLLITSTF